MKLSSLLSYFLGVTLLIVIPRFPGRSWPHASPPLFMHRLLLLI